jgi:NAD(P)-dependent dehydrogenase (short-subunit alcohol dehydrogenase family)
LGREAALALAAEGAAVVVVGRSNAVERSVELIVANGGRAMAATCDVCRPDDVDRMASRVIDEWGRIDILFNCAAVMAPPRPVVGISVEEWYATVNTNLHGTFLCSRAVLAHLIAAGGGSIVNLSSRAADHTFHQHVDAAYAASKAAVERLTRVLAEEVRPHNIAVNVLVPISLKTEGAVEARGADQDWSTFDVPAAIRPAVIFLSKQRPPYTGQVVWHTSIPIDPDDGEAAPGLAPA